METKQTETKTTPTTVPPIPQTTSCLLCEEYESGKKKKEYTCQTITKHPVSSLSSKTDQIIVLVEHTALTYADALVILGRSGGAREYPIVPGTDFSGIVIRLGQQWSKQQQSFVPITNTRFQLGDRVIAHGGTTGRYSDGGFSSLCYCDASTLTHIPSSMTTKRAAQLGSAAVTAMYAVLEIESFHRTIKGRREVIISGASGSVGGYALVILSKLGYYVTALTRDAESNRTLLMNMGAHKVVSCTEFFENTKNNGPLATEMYVGVIDTIGNEFLPKMMSNLHRGGIAVSCGCLAGDRIDDISLISFVRRGIRLCGCDSRYLELNERTKIWDRLNQDLASNEEFFENDDLFSEINFSQVQALASKKLMGGTIGLAVTVNVRLE